jgi:hypothetical protein
MVDPAHRRTDDPGAVPDVRVLDEWLRELALLEPQAGATSERTRRLQELRAWQAARMAKTYDDLLHDSQCAAAVEFFLTDIYGARSQVQRDLGRAWYLLRKTLPRQALAVLAQALELRVLTAQLDESMLGHLGEGPLSEARYAAAYRAVGRPEDRKRQIDLILSIGAALDSAVRDQLMALALRAARIPARAAGFGALQDFIERGFRAFRSMPDASRLLQAIRERETRFAAAMQSGGEAPWE